MTRSAHEQEHDSARLRVATLVRIWSEAVRENLRAVHDGEPTPWGPVEVVAMEREVHLAVRQARASGIEVDDIVGDIGRDA